MTTPANPAVTAEIVDAIADNWPDTTAGWWTWASRYEMTNAVLSGLLASPEALRWLGSHVEPEKLGYEEIGRWPFTDSHYGEPVYLAPRRETP